MNAWADAVTAVSVALALISPPIIDLADCPSSADAYRAAEAKVVEALHAYAQCVAKSHGRDKCSAEMQQLDDAHDDFETAVADYKGACPEGQTPRGKATPGAARQCAAGSFRCRPTGPSATLRPTR